MPRRKQTGFIRNRAELVRRAREHRLADRLGQGYYCTLTACASYEPGQLRSKNTWTLCAVGCLATPVNLKHKTMHPYTVLEREFGMPPELAGLADCIFEASSREAAKWWPEEFARALPRRRVTSADIKALIDRDPALNRIESNWPEPTAWDAYRARKALLRWLRTGE